MRPRLSGKDYLGTMNKAVLIACNRCCKILPTLYLQLVNLISHLHILVFFFHKITLEGCVPLMCALTISYLWGLLPSRKTRAKLKLDSISGSPSPPTPLGNRQLKKQALRLSLNTAPRLRIYPIPLLPVALPFTLFSMVTSSMLNGFATESISNS